MRVSEAEEDIGLDLSQHGEGLEVFDTDTLTPKPNLKIVSR
jgi:uncharacterized protein YuzE